MGRIATALNNNWQFALTDSVNRRPQADGWSAVSLPHDWVVNRPMSEDADWGVCMAFRQWKGVGWYRTTVEVGETNAARRYWLDVDGAQECATVWVNGAEVGYQAYGYTPFRLEVTNAVKVGANEILVRLDFTQAPTDRWYSGSGLTRTITWIETAERCVDERNVVIRQGVDPETREAALTVDSGYALDADEVLRIKLLDADGLVVASANVDAETAVSKERNAVAEFVVHDAHLWSADTPYLYTLELSLANKNSQGDPIDSVSQRIGLRDVEFNPDEGMLINGRKTIFKGVCLHQDYACVGAATTKDLWRERLVKLKRMGCNGLRLAHHIHPREMMDLADEMGFYVYEEPFDKWHSGHYLRFFDEGWKSDLDAMFQRDRNRPSVVMWGVGNEIEDQGKKPMLALLRQLVDEAHRMDPTRPVGCAMNPHFQYDDVEYGDREDMETVFNEAPKTGEITDPADRVERIKRIADITDIAVLNYAEQWYDRVREAVPDKPIFGSETYQWFMGHDEQLQNYTQSNPQLVPLREDRRYVIGGAIWSGYDYLGESMGWPSKGWSAAPLRSNGVARFSYDILRSYWTDEPMVSFAVLDYTLPDEMVKEHWGLPPYVKHWDFPQFTKALIPYAVASNCDEVRIWVNGKRYYVPCPSDCPNRLVTGYLPWAPGVVMVEGVSNGEVTCRDVTHTPVGPVAGLVFESDCPDACRDGSVLAGVGVPARRGYEQLFTVRSVDANGNLVFRSNARIEFAVYGSAHIVAVDNGNLVNDEPYAAEDVTSHRGRASVLVRFDGVPGRVDVVARCGDASAAQLECEVR